MIYLLCHNFLIFSSILRHIFAAYIIVEKVKLTTIPSDSLKTWDKIASTLPIVNNFLLLFRICNQKYFFQPHSSNEKTRQPSNLTVETCLSVWESISDLMGADSKWKSPQNKRFQNLTSQHNLSDHKLHHQELHHTFNSKSTLNAQQQINFERQMLEHITSKVPYGQQIYSKAEEVVKTSKETALSTYKKTNQRVQQSRKRYNQFRNDAVVCFNNIARETSDEFLGRVETLLGVQRKSGSAEQQKIRMRIQAIYETILREYLLKYSSLVKEKTMGMIELGKKYSIQYTMPLYINLKAVMLVSRQMFLEFLQNYLDDVKMTYESSKDMVTMFINGKFNEENIKTKLMERIDNFKQLTVEVVNKGLKIKIDRKTLMENYDKFAVQFLEIAKEMRDKSEDNIGSIKKRSRALYKEVIQRIREKELQIRCEMRMIENRQEKDEKNESQVEEVPRKPSEELSGPE